MIHAPLCKRCARMLRESVLAVQKIGAIESDAADVCPWCQKNRPDFLYEIQAIEK